MRLASCLIVLALIGCGGGSSGSSSGVPHAFVQQTATPTPENPRGHIRHVVIVIQENRSFDNLFFGYPGADTATSAHVYGGGSVTLQPVSLTAPFDLAHEHGAALLDVDGGKMDGFSTETVEQLPSATPIPNAMFSYVPTSEVQPYRAMSGAGVLADRFFSELDASYVAHQYLIAGQAGQAIDEPNNYPWGCDAPPPTRITLVDAGGHPSQQVFPCFRYPTLGDELDAKNISWRYYADVKGQLGYLWSAYDAIEQIRSTSAWARHVISPETTFLTDVAAGNLPAVTWVTPSVGNSDHPDSLSATGPRWVSSVVDAIGQSAFWNECAVLVLWDDWGGFYDHVPPPTGDQFGPGIRVPLIVLSPFGRHGIVAHSTYTFGSVMRLIEDAFGLPRLTGVDGSAFSFGGDVFDFSRPPAPYPGPFGRPAQRALILRQPPSTKPDPR